MQHSTNQSKIMWVLLFFLNGCPSLFANASSSEHKCGRQVKRCQPGLRHLHWDPQGPWQSPRGGGLADWPRRRVGRTPRWEPLASAQSAEPKLFEEQNRPILGTFGGGWNLSKMQKILFGTKRRREKMTYLGGFLGFPLELGLAVKYLQCKYLLCPLQEIIKHLQCKYVLSIKRDRHRRIFWLRSKCMPNNFHSSPSSTSLSEKQKKKHIPYLLWFLWRNGKKLNATRVKRVIFPTAGRASHTFEVWTHHVNWCIAPWNSPSTHLRSLGHLRCQFHYLQRYNMSGSGRTGLFRTGFT